MVPSVTPLLTVLIGPILVFVFVCNSIEAWLAMVVEFLGETPLIHAARQGRLQTAEYLLGHGADPSIASNMGATALHHAAGIGNDWPSLQCPGS
jgi:hypothetical protein